LGLLSEPCVFFPPHIPPIARPYPPSSLYPFSLVSRLIIYLNPLTGLGSLVNSLLENSFFWSRLSPSEGFKFFYWTLFGCAFFSHPLAVVFFPRPFLSFCPHPPFPIQSRGGRFFPLGHISMLFQFVLDDGVGVFISIQPCGLPPPPYCPKSFTNWWLFSPFSRLCGGRWKPYGLFC